MPNRQSFVLLHILQKQPDLIRTGAPSEGKRERPLPKMVHQKHISMVDESQLSCAHRDKSTPMALLCLTAALIQQRCGLPHAARKTSATAPAYSPYSNSNVSNVTVQMDRAMLKTACP